MATNSQTISKPTEDALMAEAEANSKNLARAYLRPITQAAVTLKQYERGLGNLDLLALVEHLHEQVEAAQSGDLRRAEEMLTAQAHTLDRLFHTLLQDAANTRRASILDLYLKLGLRAQSQCRATLEALAAMKNPRPAAFVGQNNIANVQQSNNGISAEDNRQVDAQENGFANRKVLEKGNEQRLDARETSSAGRDDSPMETVESFNGAKVC